MNLRETTVISAALAATLLVKETIAPGEISHVSKTIYKDISGHIESKLRGDVSRTIQVPQPIARTIDSLFLTTRDVPMSKENCYWGDDTIKISNEVSANPANFVKKIIDRANSKVPDAISGQYRTITPIRIKKTMIPFSVKHNIYAPKYVNNKVLIDNRILADKNSKLYLRVEYFGEENPAIKK